MVKIENKIQITSVMTTKLLIKRKFTREKVKNNHTIDRTLTVKTVKVVKIEIITKINVTIGTNMMRNLTIEMIEHFLKVQMIITKQQCIHQNTYHMTQNQMMINTIMIKINSLIQKSIRRIQATIRILNVDQNEFPKHIFN